MAAAYSSAITSSVRSTEAQPPISAEMSYAALSSPFASLIFSVRPITGKRSPTTMLRCAAFPEGHSRPAWSSALTNRACVCSCAQSERSWLTPVEIFQPHYATAIARSVVERHRRLYPAERLQVLEVGGGNGTCAAGFLACLRDQFPDEWRSCHYTLVEISENLASTQLARLSEVGIPEDRFEVINEDVISWAERTAPREGPWFVVRAHLSPIPPV
jgi:hypothetical protein